MNPNDLRFARFKDAPWILQDRNLPVILYGVGGIGSWVSLFLSRLGFVDLYMIDNDRVSETNLGGQFFMTNQVGQYKVEAVKSNTSDYSRVSPITTLSYRIEDASDCVSMPYVFSCFDNLEARRHAFNRWEVTVAEARQGHFHHANVTPFFIDGRLEAEQLQVFCVTPDKAEQYRAHLYDDSVVPEAQCTMKQTTHVAAMIASHMTSFLTNHIANCLSGIEIRVFPFYYEYFIPMAITEMKISDHDGS